jgi:hypothetical protein
MFDGETIRAEALNQLVPEAGAPYLGTVMSVRVPSPPEDLHYAFSENQIVSKKWLLDKLFESLGGRFGTVYVLGGWYGVLGAMMLNDDRFEVGRVLSYDVDPRCATVAERINGAHAEAGRFKAETADVRSLDYALSDGPDPANGSGRVANLVINTSCEHIAPVEAWYGRVPVGMPQAHQSNDQFDCPEHVNCVASLEDFKAQLPMAELVFEGALARRRYSRFMLVGRK